MQHFIFIAQESSQYLGFFKIPYVNRIDFFAFCLYIYDLQKQKIVNKWKLQWMPSPNNNELMLSLLVSNFVLKF